MNTEKLKNIAYWMTTVLGPASFVIGGVLNLTQAEQVVTVMQQLGYPLYFASIIGAWKLLGAIVIVAPLGFLALVLASWALRPANRMLAPNAEASPVVRDAANILAANATVAF